MKTQAKDKSQKEKKKKKKKRNNYKEIMRACVFSCVFNKFKKRRFRPNGNLPLDYEFAIE